jgi:hypothetical protein
MAILEIYGEIRPDGTLDLEQKLTPPGRVKVRVEPVEQAETDLGWPLGYTKLFGSIDDETFIVHPQPPMPPAVEFE